MELKERLAVLEKQEEELKTMFIKVQGAKELCKSMIAEEEAAAAKSAPKKKGK